MSGTNSPEHELDAPPWRRVESTLIAAADGIRHVYDLRLAPLGLSLSTASLLAYIREFGPLTQTRIAEHLSQGRAVTGTHVDKLERCGLVARRPDPNDRRVWLVAVTDAGRDAAALVDEVDRVLRAELRDGISRDERQVLAGLLVRLQSNIQRSLDAPPTDVAASNSSPATTSPATPSPATPSQKATPT